MSKKLVIVESPAKVKTISKFLGKDYTIEASMGHLIDLPKSSIGVDVDNDFDVKYITIRGKGQLLNKLKKKAKQADIIYLATDPDREGETISWHLKNAFNLPDDKEVHRISFNEITKNAVTNAINKPRDIDMNLVNSQQARRAIDRIVGYKISPILWDKVKNKLSAGRVQSVALRLISEREDEISKFVPDEYWTLTAKLKVGKSSHIEVNFYGKDGKKIELKDQKTVDDIIADIGNNKFKIVDVKKSQREKKPPLPFTTSTMQQEAGKILNFPISKTMSVAQKLYEGIDLPGRGTTALITYLRTDSTRIADEAIVACKNYIEQNYGNAYASDVVPQEKDKGNKVQDAHEAIRPTYIDLVPADIKDSLSKDEYKLYSLIWRRFIACRMKSAIYDTEKVTFDANSYTFNANSSKVAFQGYLTMYKSLEDEEAKTAKLPDFNVGDELDLDTFNKEQHFTQPPAHFTESSLVKLLEENGIGRPSTYAPTINTLLKRRYITKEKKNLFITELGAAVNNIMIRAFNDIVDEKFTVNMEKQLDEVESGSVGWKDVLREFYPKLKEELENAEKNLEKVSIKEEVTEEKCEKCGANLVVKYGPYGKFLACPNFPECRFTKTYFEHTGTLCPKCKKNEVYKLRTKRGRIFFGCSSQDCDYMTWQLPKDAEVIPGLEKYVDTENNNK
ncbi:MAG: type I DNA topoisomerase [Lachnospiraceae bacterium]|nr:type I DNA topoisomerase [Lachnospiraceae bacterium]